MSFIPARYVAEYVSYSPEDGLIKVLIPAIDEKIRMEYTADFGIDYFLEHLDAVICSAMMVSGHASHPGYIELEDLFSHLTGGSRIEQTVTDSNLDSLLEFLK